jgi:NitT/TauT family transport system ATP-binding protein
LTSDDGRAGRRNSAITQRHPTKPNLFVIGRTFVLAVEEGLIHGTYQVRDSMPMRSSIKPVTIEKTIEQVALTRGAKPFIEAEGLRIAFGATPVLNGIDITIAEGEFFSILGPSGCGKSTFLLLTAGLLQPTGGKISVEGKPVRGAYTNAGITFQNHNLLEWRTVLDNILLPLEIRHIKNDNFIKRTHELLALVGLEGFEKHYPHQLSGGMRQRVAICRALVCDLPLLLMDEPFGALDALTREEHQLLLQDVWLRERKTVLFITHDIREAILLSDRVAIMSPRPGRILDILDIDLPRPRSQDISESPAFIDYSRRIRSQLFAKPAGKPT